MARRVARKSAAWLVGFADGSGLTDPAAATAAGCDVPVPAAGPTACNTMSWDKLIFLMPGHWHLRCQSQENCGIVSPKEAGTAVGRFSLGKPHSNLVTALFGVE